MATADLTTKSLIAGADLAELHTAMPTPPAMPATKAGPWRPAPRPAQPPAHSCKQTLTLTFFFDGTGNNLDADVGTFEHSNVARLYRAHQLDDDSVGRFRFYLPGLGTYFIDREVNDPGGTWNGAAFASQGQARLNWALARFDEKVADAAARANNPTNKICWIKVAVFGFSRGAALARAFCRDLQARCEPSGDHETGGWVLKRGKYPVDITFSGLFDTVASSGVPDSANNLYRNRHLRDAARAIPLPAKLALDLVTTPELKLLAFGNAPGADPAPGFANGHGGWADGLAVGGMTRQCLHLLAAHEIRNSFPLDTAMVEHRPNQFAPPAGCVEMVYPGSHSDVGGGYRPGEGGCKTERGAQLSLITLRLMHQRAIEAGVPLVALSGLTGVERADFAIDPAGATEFTKMAATWNHYGAYVRQFPIPGAVPSLGLVLNQHMRAFYAWRFQAMKAQQAERSAHQPVAQEERVNKNERAFAADRAAIDRELKAAGNELFIARNKADIARTQMQSAEMSEARFGTPPNPSAARRLDLANREAEGRQVEYDRIRARKSTAADDSGLNEATAKYDRMLLADARQIVAWMRADRTLKLRPHYFALVDAYLDEYQRERGLRDAQVIAFFDGYVHDSLAGFDFDETWPSDPRIVYVGGDNRLRYAATPAREGANEAMLA